MARVRLEDIHKTYANGFQAVKGIDLEIADGELVVLVGPSGCGKSTALRLIAGLETPTRGRITIGDRDVTNVRVQDRDVAMVFQSYALYPHRTVRQNLAFALELRRVDRASIERRVAAVSAMLGLEPLLDRKPAQLSGGQRQRVALGRAIVREPQVFLFDEPLSNLDARLRVQTRTELARLHRRLGATMVYVTHDQEEAMTLGDRIAVLEAGRLQQCGPPLEVYRRPANVFVAGFVGSPSMNFLDERIGAVLGAPPEVLCAIRPEDIELTDPEAAAVSGRVGVVERLGSSTVAHIDVDGSNVRVTLNADERVEEDHSVGLRLPLDRLHRFNRETGTRLTGFDAETA